jgi:tetratricopeptide (TPR) repeat protein
MPRVFCVWLTLAAALFVWASARGQFPDKFTNLKVLPKDISKQELQSTMRGFAFALGVRCDHCHVEKKPAASGYDFSADDKEAKKTARVMLRMVGRINRDYLGKLARGDRSPLIHVECMTCHHGLTRPQPLNAVLAASLDKDGLDKTIALYHELRGQYYGTGQYDFGETPLNLLAESLLGNERNADALAVMDLSFAMNHPDSVWSYHMFAMAHQANGQLDQAIADYRKVLELHPDDSWAKQQIDSLSKPKGDN